MWSYAISAVDREKILHHLRIECNRSLMGYKRHNENIFPMYSVLWIHLQKGSKFRIF